MNLQWLFKTHERLEHRRTERTNHHLDGLRRKLRGRRMSLTSSPDLQEEEERRPLVPNPSRP